MDYKKEYARWLIRARIDEIAEELLSMDEAQIEDAFYCDLSFGTGGLRGIIGAGTNRMNEYVVAKASQGLSSYLCPGASVVIGYDSRIKSETFARTAAEVFAANGITVYIWPALLPVPTVSFAVRALNASAGVMITASHNPSKYNGYKVYGPDGCQITTEAADEILSRIKTVDIFDGVMQTDFDAGLAEEKIRCIDASILDAFIDAVKAQSVLYGDAVDKNMSIVYTPLNGTGLIPVTRALNESGFSNITVVEEQRLPDGNFPTCPYPNPEIMEAMELGLKYCRETGADLLLATDPDADRCGIAVKDGTEYRLLSGNEVGLLLLDYVCHQRQKHGRMPAHPVFVKTIVTMDLAEKIAEHYGVETINVLTGFKFIGEQISELEKQGRVSDYICGFEESYGYLTGTYVRDKDAVNAAYMICEMFAYYKTRGVSLIDRLNYLYGTYGYCLNTLCSYQFEGSAGMEKMECIMQRLRCQADVIAGQRIIKVLDYAEGLDGLPKSNVLKFFIPQGSVVVRPSGTEPKLKVYLSVRSKDHKHAELFSEEVMKDMERTFFDR